MLTKRWIATFVAVVAILSLLAACGPATPQVVEKEVVVEKPVVETVVVEKEVQVEVTKVIEKEVEVVVLKVSVAEFPDALPGRQQFLEEAMARATSELGEEHGMSVEIEFSVRILGGSVCANCESYAHPTILENDLYLLDSPSALHAFKDHELVPVPGDILQSVDPFEPSVQAFIHPDGRVLGLAQATASLMVIYNPEKLDISPEEQLSWDDVFRYAEADGLAVPAHSCVVIAAFQSAAGDDLTEGLIFQGDYRELVSLGAPIIDGLSQLGDQLAQGYGEMVERFINQEVALVLHNTGYLAKLAEAGYEGPVATTRFPVLNHPGGAAHTAGWVVPAASANPELAWALAEKLTRDPAMLQWGLANGMAPANRRSFDMLVQDPSLADGLLPKGLFHDSGLMGLLNSTAESKAWRIPSYVPIEDYNEIFLPGGNMLASTIANDKIPLEEATELLEKVRTQLELRFDPEAFFDLGITYYEMGDYDRAIANFDQAIALDPRYAEVYSKRGATYAKIGERDKAVSDLERALELGLDPSLEQDTEALLEELGQ